MKSELSFLIDLLLNHKLVKATAELIAERIKEVEANLSARPAMHQPIAQVPKTPHIAAQAPSMQAIMARHPDLIAGVPVQQELNSDSMLVPSPIAVIAQTPAASAAMASRNQAINESISGKIDKVSGRPRKF